jgi:serine/threonine-protein kinase
MADAEPAVDPGSLDGGSTAVNPGASDADAAAAGLVRIPAGSFAFLARFSNGGTGPVQRLTHAFYVDRFEVSVAQYKEWVAGGRSSPCAGASCALEPGGPYAGAMAWAPTNDGALGERTCTDESYATYGGSDARAPINCVNWPQAVAVCHFRGMRLLTNVEWQYIASGRGQSRKYPWGDAPEPADCTQATFGLDDPGSNPCGFPRPVGTARSDVSLDGVHDLAGSLAEWVYDTPPDSALGPGVDLVLAETAKPDRVTRGGHYRSRTDDLVTSAWTRATAQEGSYGTGFRCAKTEL